MRPDIAADMARLGFVPRRILLHIAFSVSKLKNNSSFETEKESLSEIRHQLRIDAREGARAASVHQGCIPEGSHRLRRSSNAYKSIWMQAKPPASSVTHGKAT